MIFNSWIFLAFFLFVYLAYLKSSHRIQNWLLLGASYVFYGFWDYRFLGLIVLSTLIDYFCGLRIGGTENQRIKRRFVLISVISNLGILGAFKYCDFFLSNAESILRMVGMEPSPMTLGIVVPVGISFYTFQSLSYTIDVYREDLAPCRNFRDFALYVSFFPQLVAGPIERASRLVPQVQNRRVLRWEQIREGFWLCLLGYFTKVYVADNLAPIANSAFAEADGTAGGATLLLGTVAFAFQIYGDFAGYSNIARGLSKFLGFDLVENFKVPYVSASPSEFWARWHVSLSSWLRDYLYIPLGGNRGGTSNMFRNLMLTMVLGGLWHGTDWKFVIWGFYQGALLIMFRVYPLSLIDSVRQQDSSWLTRGLIRLFATPVFFLFTLQGWLIFRCDRLSQIWEIPYRAVTSFSWTEQNEQTLIIMAMLLLPLMMIDVVHFLTQRIDWICRVPLPVRWPIYASLFAAIAIFGKRVGEPFIYFQF